MHPTKRALVQSANVKQLQTALDSTALGANSKSVTMGLIGELVNDIVRFNRAATGQPNAKGCRTHSQASARVPIRRVRECTA
jgi:hypothetical protein